MEKIELKDAFAEFKNQKNIDRPTMMGVLEDVFRTQIAKVYGSADNFDVIINIDKGDCEIYWNREVVEEVEDPNTQISLEEVNADGDDYEIGETFAKRIEMKDFGRRGILNIRQNLQGRIMDLEKANLYNKYKEKVGQLFSGEVHQPWSKEVIILDEDGNEYGLQRLETLWKSIAHHKPEPNEAINAILLDTHDFADGEPQSDDQTIMVITAN